MPRSIWNGTISFGLVNVPVQLFSATEQKDIHFHQMTRSGHRVRYKRVDEKTGREVDYDDIVKGYARSKGKIVLVEPEELEAATPKQMRAIEIEDFVELAEIDPIYFDQTYYVAPRKEGGADRAYALLRDAMDRTGRVGIGRFVMRTKQYLVAIRPRDDMLLLETLFFADEIRDARALDLPKRTRGGTRELKIAEQLIESQTVAFEPKRYRDTYRAEVQRIIARKARGEEIAVEQPAERRGEVIDLVDALRASLDERRTGRSRSRTGRPTAKRARRAS